MSSFSLGSAHLDLGASDAGLQRALGRVRGMALGMQSSLRRVGNVSRTALIGGGAAVGAFAAEAGRFESQMSKVETLMTGDALSMMPEFRDGIREMSIEFAQSTGTLSDGLFDIISAGIAPSEAMNVLRASAKAAAGGFTETGVAANALSRSLVAYGIGAENAEAVTDKLLAAADAGMLNFEGLASNVGKVAPMANRAGMSLEHMLAAFSTLSQAASPEESATQLLNLFRAFTKPAEKAQAAAAGIGLKLGSAALRGDQLFKTVARFQGMSLDRVMQIIPDQQAAQAILSLAGNLDFLRRTHDQVMNSGGTSTDKFKKRLDDFDFKMGQVKQTILDISGTMGDMFLPILKEIADRFRAAMPAVKEWIASHKELLLDLAPTAAGLLAFTFIISKIPGIAALASGAIRGIGAAAKFAMAHPLVAAAVPAVGLFAAAVTRAIVLNESWEQSTYGVIRALGLLPFAALDLQDARDALAKTTAEFHTARKIFEGSGPDTAKLRAAINLQTVLQQRIAIMERIAQLEGEAGTNLGTAVAIAPLREELAKVEAIVAAISGQGRTDRMANAVQQITDAVNASDSSIIPKQIPDWMKTFIDDWKRTVGSGALDIKDGMKLLLPSVRDLIKFVDLLPMGNTGGVLPLMLSAMGTGLGAVASIVVNSFGQAQQAQSQEMVRAAQVGMEDLYRQIQESALSRPGEMDQVELQKQSVVEQQTTNKKLDEVIKVAKKTFGWK